MFSATEIWLLATQSPVCEGQRNPALPVASTLRHSVNAIADVGVPIGFLLSQMVCSARGVVVVSSGHNRANRCPW